MWRMGSGVGSYVSRPTTLKIGFIFFFDCGSLIGLGTEPTSGWMDAGRYCIPQIALLSFRPSCGIYFMHMLVYCMITCVFMYLSACVLYMYWALVFVEVCVRVCM